MLQLGLKSDLGQVRAANEDFYLARRFLVAGHDSALLAIADGIGGYRGGEVASRTAIGSLEREFERAVAAGEAWTEALATAFCAANRAVFQLSLLEERYRGMGTTLTAAFFRADCLVAAHVGDSRLYLYRDRSFRQLTEDHSLVHELVRNGEISPEEARKHPQRNVLTRAVGTGVQVDVDLFTEAMLPADIVLIASDGLFSLLEDEDLAAHLDCSDNLQTAAECMVAQANERGGHDNITVILARWGCEV